MSHRLRTFGWLILGVVATACAPLSAQWLHQPTGGLSRSADGKPDLTAPAPRLADGSPDLTGLWRLNPGSYVIDVTQDLRPADIQPWADTRFRQRVHALAGDPACFLPSGPRYYTAGIPKIIQTPLQLVFLNDDLTYRQIFLDGRLLPRDPNPSFMGYSTGHWDGDALIVESTGLDERTLLDTGGHPHTERMHVTERFHRIDVGHMDVQVTFDDPAIYARPIVVPVTAQLVPDDELIEFICRENEKDYEHMGGTAVDAKQHVATEVLSKYVGVYEYTTLGGAKAAVHVTLVEGELVIDRIPWVQGKSRQTLIPLSETRFAAYFGWPLHFVTDSAGAIAVVFEALDPPLREVIATRQH